MGGGLALCSLPHAHVQWDRVPQPTGALRMVSLLVVRIGMDEGAEGSAMHDEPCHECPELGGIEQVHFEHRKRMRTDGLVPKAIDAEFGD
jgi:hypothetical protein